MPLPSQHEIRQTGKKKVKAISRALQKANRSPSHPSIRNFSYPQHDQSDRLLSSDPRSSFRSEIRHDLPQDTLQVPSTPVRSNGLTPRSTSARSERQPLRAPGSRFSGVVGTYGSIVATPPSQQAASSDVASLRLPDPAIDPKEVEFSSPEREDDTDDHRPESPSPILSRYDSLRPATPARSRRSPSTPQPAAGGIKDYKRNTGAGPSNRRGSLLQRVLSYQDWNAPEKRDTTDTSTSEIAKRQDEFFAFLDGELAKIDSFYQMKEQEAAERLKVLRSQLHIMRDQRTQEVLGKTKNGGIKKDNAQANGFGGFAKIKDAFPGRHFGKNSKALAELATPVGQAQDLPNTITRRDFARRPEESNNAEVPYRSAKRKLKHALQEFYRGVELLKAYAYLNRTAFRKINKKYDKVVNAHPPMRYLSEKVNKAWFVQSEVTEHLLSAAEDLYARYFERGNRKIAASKLRHTVNKAGDYSPNTFRSGLLLMAGILFAAQALVYASRNLDNDDSDVKLNTSYLLQLPSFFLFILGLFMWLNFMMINDAYIYWPVVLIGVTVIVLFLPVRTLYHHSRKWWAYSNWRLLLAGLYPVEFRDFFLGDMYCSQTYAMGNIELFFCLYAKHWSDPQQCNSSHSRLLGFFTCLPGIWRALQCLRRYADTRNAFPHLLNFGKYMFTVLYYCTLSLYRIDKVSSFEAPFITFALLNAVYCSVWDLAMDWSLGNPHAKNPMLREVLAFRKPWVYYVGMVIDVVVRFNWIFYAIFRKDIQHSAVLSFAVALSEVGRRGVWTIFRVENEHCTNVLLFRASRDVPLPYEVPKPQAPSAQPEEAMQLQDHQPLAPVPTIGDAEQGTPPTPGLSVRSPRGLARVGTLLAAAHAQDFQRKRRPGELHSASITREGLDTPEDSTDEEEGSRPSSEGGNVIVEEYRDDDDDQE
ncbi:SPX and EXS domain-containing protein [Aspergillus fijiensis CBS 313.89]|uniref:EXS-domain-containing protein n=1 Tax=Aspergillus fijiensis CBS 313.89 TaxID=1448319 RepID=A0A8G1W2Z8_9EURO|nr:EXS-domain-containing protein [Aspergillus fijiensis CBS 313.89]RAK81016.1 EXS-domain-containing protein [Aspergillus fijiensis CBS 313.89]